MQASATYYSGNIVMQSSHCNSFEDLALIFRCPSSHELQWIDKGERYQDRSPKNGCQGDMTYCFIILNVLEGCGDGTGKYLIQLFQNLISSFPDRYRAWVLFPNHRVGVETSDRFMDTKMFGLVK